MPFWVELKKFWVIWELGRRELHYTFAHSKFPFPYFPLLISQNDRGLTPAFSFSSLPFIVDENSMKKMPANARL